MEGKAIFVGKTASMNRASADFTTNYVYDNQSATDSSTGTEKAVITTLDKAMCGIYYDSEVSATETVAFLISSIEKFGGK